MSIIFNFLCITKKIRWQEQDFGNLMAKELKEKSKTQYHAVHLRE